MFFDTNKFRFEFLRPPRLKYKNPIQNLNLFTSEDLNESPPRVGEISATRDLQTSKLIKSSSINPLLLKKKTLKSKSLAHIATSSEFSKTLKMNFVFARARVKYFFKDFQYFNLVKRKSTYPIKKFLKTTAIFIIN